MSTSDFGLLKKFKSFSGVYAHDQLPKQIKRLDSGIINLDESTGTGSHWVAYYNNGKDKDVYYFDSFGVMPDERTIKFLETSGKRIKYNTSQIQDIVSNRCGWYTIHFLKNMNAGKSFYDSLYTPYTQIPSKNNESIIQDF